MTKILTIQKLTVPRDSGVRRYSEPKARMIGGRPIPKSSSSRSLPTIMDVQLGKAFVEHCLILGIDFLTVDMVVHKHFIISKNTTLGDLYEAACYEVEQYNIDNETDHKIGDFVQVVRRSSDDMTLIYGEVEEDRPDRLSHHDHYDPNRYDGDARFNALTDEDYQVIWDGGKWTHDGNDFVFISKNEYFRQ